MTYLKPFSYFTRSFTKRLNICTSRRDIVSQKRPKIHFHKFGPSIREQLLEGIFRLRGKHNMTTIRRKLREIRGCNTNIGYVRKAMISLCVDGKVNKLGMMYQKAGGIDIPHVPIGWKEYNSTDRIKWVHDTFINVSLILSPAEKNQLFRYMTDKLLSEQYLSIKEANGYIRRHIFSNIVLRSAFEKANRANKHKILQFAFSQKNIRLGTYIENKEDSHVERQLDINKRPQKDKASRRKIREINSVNLPFPKRFLPNGWKNILI